MLLKEIKNIKSTPKQLREFGWVVGGAAFVFAGIAFWRHGAWNWTLIGIGATLVVLGTVWPPVLMPLQKAWMTLALMMGWVMSRVILMVLFYLILTPLALFQRLTGKRFMERGTGTHEDSYWHLRDRSQFDSKRCEKQF